MKYVFVLFFNKLFPFNPYLLSILGSFLEKIFTCKSQVCGTLLADLCETLSRQDNIFSVNI